MGGLARLSVVWEIDRLLSHLYWVDGYLGVINSVVDVTLPIY